MRLLAALATRRCLELLGAAGSPSAMPLAGGLRPVHRAVGSVDQRLGLVPVLGRGRHADRDGRRAGRPATATSSLDRGREAGRQLRRALQVLLGQRARRTRRRRSAPPCPPTGSTGAATSPTCIRTRSPAGWPVRVVDPLESVDVHQQHRERVLVALVDVQQGRELALERAQVPEAGERVRVGLRLELARAGRPHAPPSPRPGSPPVASTSCSTASANRTGSSSSSSRSACRSTVWSAATSRATSAARVSRRADPERRQRRRALGLLLRQA